MAEMWERFCYYGMRALLTLYLIKSLSKGDAEAFAIYGAYTALVYAAPVLGGRIADQLLGYRNAVILGGILMAIGEFMILGGGDAWLYAGMGAIIVGNGYFKANISSIVGRLYNDEDPRKDSGFTIFYIGINIGALLATTVCAEVGNIYGYQYGFALAGVGMLAGIAFFVLGQKHIEGLADPPNPEKLKEPFVGPLNRFHVTILASLAVIPMLYLLILKNEWVFYLLIGTAVFVIYNLLETGSRGDSESLLLSKVFAGVSLANLLFYMILDQMGASLAPLQYTLGISGGFLLYYLVRLFRGAFTGDKVLRDRLMILIILITFNIVFWACFEQAGTSLTLFAERNVDRNIFGWEMGAATTQFFNPAFILIFGSIFSGMWVWLSRIGKNPNIPAKFGLGILQLGLGYLVVQLGAAFAGPDFLVPLWTLALLYLLHTTGELFLSPIGLSMVTKLAPKTMTGTVMGAWFLSFAFSNYLAALLAKLTSAGGHGEASATEVVASAADSLAQYVDVYSTIGYITVGIGLFLVLVSPFLNRMMHGVK